MFVKLLQNEMYDSIRPVGCNTAFVISEVDCSTIQTAYPDSVNYTLINACRDDWRTCLESKSVSDSSSDDSSSQGHHNVSIDDLFGFNPEKVSVVGVIATGIGFALSLAVVAYAIRVKPPKTRRSNERSRLVTTHHHSRGYVMVN
jgi:hypothetical protein